MYLSVDFENGNTHLSIGLDKKQMQDKVKQMRKEYIMKRIKTDRDGNRHYTAVRKN